MLYLENWFFLLGINFCDFQEVAFNLELKHSLFLVQIAESSTGEQHADI